MIPDKRVNSFHVGQVWGSPKGTFYRVMDRQRGGKATLRLGADGSGRKMVRDWDAVIGWVLYGDPEYADEYPTGQETRA
ncbi:hypothetical protein [Thioalkalivibrio sp. ALE16]|uniref:hypothetical protein n=1 Tax=Thioalkalivibrio sp. ALE16 TaxID=1158172 RepID=UPI0003818248|nr:hypothetical protein [Thioalkalivibrio sp. ALE16]